MTYNKEWHREYYRKNREKILEYQREYQRKRKEEDPDTVLDQQRKSSAAWRKRNPEKAKEIAKRGRDAARARAVEYVHGIKASTPCADCGNIYPPECMDFDHINDDKEHDVGRLVSQNRGLDLIKAEIAKCELVCSNCHRVRTRSRIVKLKGATQHDDND